MNNVDIDVKTHDDTDLDPVKKKFKTFTDDLVNDSKAAGQKAGAALGTGMAAEVEKASQKVSVARKREADETGRLRVAEVKLAEIRQNEKAKDSQRIAAEELVAKKLRDVETATRAVTDAEAKLSKERARAREESSKEADTTTTDKTSKVDVKKLIGGGLMSEMKSTGLQAGALFAGALGAGISSVGAAGIFVGIAAAAQSSNAVVRAAYKTTWDSIKTQVQDASTGMAVDFINGAETLGRTFNALKPQLTEGFIAAKPLINGMFDGVSRLAQTAMPGLVTAAKASSQTISGLGDMLDSAGRGVSNFFTESSKGAGAGGDAFRSFGVIVERLGSFAGRVLADLANNSGTVFPVLAHVVDSAATVVENFAHVALPGIASGATLALSGVGLLLNLANTLIGVLGPLIPMASTFATSMKLIDMVSFGQVGKSWDSFKTSLSEGEGFIGKVKSGFGSLLSSGIGPMIVGGFALTGLLNELSKDEQRVAEATKAHEQNVSSLSAALRESKGVVDANVRSSAAQALVNTKVGDTGKNVLEVSKSLGMSLPQLTDGFLGNKDAMKAVNDQLDLVIANGTTYIDTETSKQAVTTTSADNARMLKLALASGNTTMAEAILKNEAFATAAGTAATNTNTLAADFKTLADGASSAQQKVSALVTIMDTMAGRKPDVEAATKTWLDFIAGFNVKDGGFKEVNAGTRKWADSLVDARGQINLTSADGRKLFDLVKNAESDFAATSQAMKDSGASAGEINSKLTEMRAQFVDTAQKMGFTKTQAELMANAYGMIPSNVSTLVTSNLAPEIQKAVSLGAQIRSLPNGYISVIANTDPARNSITSLIQDAQGRVINIKVNTVTGVNTATSLSASGSVYRSRYQAAGGPAASVSSASGGARTGVINVNEMGLETATLPNRDQVILPTGSSINPHDGNLGLQGNNGWSPEITFNFTGADGRIARAFQDIIRYIVQQNGGSVQRSFGGKN